MNGRKYQEINRDEVKYYFDILQNKSINIIAELTGFGCDFVQKTLNDYR